MRAIAFRNGPLDRNTGRNVKRSADVSGNARHFCDCELNYTGCEEKRLEAMTVRRLAARDLEQVVRTNLERLEPLLFRTQLHRIRASQPELNYTEFELSSPSSTTPGCETSHPKTKNQTNTKRGKTK